MKMPPVFWGLIASPIWGGMGIMMMAFLAAAGLDSASLMEGLGVLAATALILRLDVVLRPNGMPGVGLRRPRLEWLGAALLAGIGVAILGSEIDNIVRDRFPLVITPLTAEQIAATSHIVAGPLWIGALSRGLIVPFARVFIATGVTLRNLVAGMPWRVALMVSAFAFAYPTHEHPAYWLPWVLAPLIGGWAYLRTHNIWLAVAVAFPQHGVAWFEFLGIAPNIAGFDTPVGEVAVFQPLWFDALGLVLLMVGVGLLIRGFEVAGAAVPLPKPPRPSTGAEPPDAEDGED